MRVYTVHTHPAKPPEDAVFVKEGFCWPGLLIPFFWLIFRRLWIPLMGFIAAVVLIAIVPATGLAGEGFTGPATLALHLLVGLEGNNLRRWRLKAQGYELVDIVVADNMGEAEIEYYTAREGEAAQAAAAETRAGGAPWGQPA